MKQAKRPRDPFQLAKQIGDIATGQLDGDPPQSPKAGVKITKGKNSSAVGSRRKPR